MRASLATVQQALRPHTRRVPQLGLRCPLPSARARAFSTATKGGESRDDPVAATPHGEPSSDTADDLQVSDEEIESEEDDEELRDELLKIETVIKRTKTYEPRKKKHEWLLTLMGYYLPKEKRHRAAHFMYHKCLQHAMNPAFWNIMALEPCFRTELQILCLHMWLAKTRCMAMEDDDLGRKLNKAAFNMMFKDFSLRFEKYISGFVTKWERDCQQVCFQLALSMDHALHDEEEDPEAIAKVIWQHLYLSNSDMEHDVLYLWSDYIKNEISSLRTEIDDDEFMKGWWQFGEPPTYEQLLDMRRRLRMEEGLPEEPDGEQPRALPVDEKTQ